MQFIQLLINIINNESFKYNVDYVFKIVLQYQEKITQLNFIFVVYTSCKWHISFFYFIENKQTFKLIF